MILPLGMRGLAVGEAISLYGGLTLLSGFILHEWVALLMCLGTVLKRLSSTRKILYLARLSDQELMERDPMNAAIGLKIDVLNILCVHHFVSRHDFPSLIIHLTVSVLHIFF